jgi:hypothetical protein
MLSPSPLLWQEGIVFTGAVATFTTSDPSPSVANYSAVITWGDGTITSGTIAVQNGGFFSVNGTHTYAEENSYPMSIAVHDSVDSSNWTVSNTALVQDAPVSAYGAYFASTPNTPFSGIVAFFLDANSFATAGSFSAIINWGDGTLTPATITANSPGSFNVSGSHTYINAGLKTVTITVNDIGGSSATTTSYTGDHIFADGFGG